MKLHEAPPEGTRHPLREGFPVSGLGEPGAPGRTGSPGLSAAQPGSGCTGAAEAPLGLGLFHILRQRLNT